MGHSIDFFNFINELNKEDIKYFLMRGFDKLPEKPDTDVDLVCHHDDWKRYVAVGNKTLELWKQDKRGFAEYCNMIYRVYKTKSKPDKTLPNKCFRVDSYCGLFFKSPYNNFKTFWTLPEKFLNLVCDEVILDKRYSIPFYKPAPVHEIVLLLARDMLDLKGKWKSKHTDKINKLMPDISIDDLKSCLSIVFPKSDEITKLLLKKQFNKIFKVVMK